MHATISECDRVIADSKNKPLPPIDDVLVAPTIVQNQLWNLEAEVAGLKEAVWVLQRAVVVGRVSAEGFVRLNRTLGRELFLKMALGRRVARGLRLDLGGAGAGGGRGGGSGGEGEGYYG